MNTVNNNGQKFSIDPRRVIALAATPRPADSNGARIEEWKARGPDVRTNHHAEDALSPEEWRLIGLLGSEGDEIETSRAEAEADMFEKDAAAAGLPLRKGRADTPIRSALWPDMAALDGTPLAREARQRRVSQLLVELAGNAHGLKTTARLERASDENQPWRALAAQRLFEPRRAAGPSDQASMLGSMGATCCSCGNFCSSFTSCSSGGRRCSSCFSARAVCKGCVGRRVKEMDCSKSAVQCVGRASSRGNRCRFDGRVERRRLGAGPRVSEGHAATAARAKTRSAFGWGSLVALQWGAGLSMALLVIAFVLTLGWAAAVYFPLFASAGMG